MTLRPKLRLMMLRDVIYLASVVGLFYLPSPFELLLLIGVISICRKFEPKIKADAAPLESRERRIYFGWNVALFAILLALLLRFIIRHSSPPAWAMGSLGIIVLLTLLYAGYDSIYGRNTKI
jgi:hypothetical protein